MRAEYLDDQIGKKVGSADWIANVSATRQRVSEMVAEHVSDFAHMLTLATVIVRNSAN